MGVKKDQGIEQLLNKKLLLMAGGSFNDLGFMDNSADFVVCFYLLLIFGVLAVQIVDDPVETLGFLTYWSLILNVSFLFAEWTTRGAHTLLHDAARRSKSSAARLSYQNWAKAMRKANERIVTSLYPAVHMQTWAVAVGVTALFLADPDVYHRSEHEIGSAVTRVGNMVIHYIPFLVLYCAVIPHQYSRIAVLEAYLRVQSAHAGEPSLEAFCFTAIRATISPGFILLYASTHNYKTQYATSANPGVLFSSLMGASIVSGVFWFVNLVQYTHSVVHRRKKCVFDIKDALQK